jgi:hypothetical protein
VPKGSGFFAASASGATPCAQMRPPPRTPSVSPPWSFAVTRPGGREATVAEMLGDLVTACGLRPRRQTMRQMFAQARQIDRLADELDDLDSGREPDSPLALARRMKGRGEAR